MKSQNVLVRGNFKVIVVNTIKKMEFQFINKYFIESMLIIIFKRSYLFNQ